MCEFSTMDGSDGFSPIQLITTIGVFASNKRYTLNTKSSDFAWRSRNLTHGSMFNLIFAQRNNEENAWNNDAILHCSVHYHNRCGYCLNKRLVFVNTLGVFEFLYYLPIYLAL